jgi:hypothetical protein
VIGRGRLGHHREPPVVVGEAARLDDDAGDGHAVAADELGRRVHHDVGAPLDRPAQVGRGEGVVDHQRDAVLGGHRCHSLDVEHVGPGLPMVSPYTSLVLSVMAAAKVGVRVDERDVDPHAPQGHVELGVGAAVEIAGGDDLVALGHSVSTAISWAAWPDEVATAPNPPSNEATRSSKAAVVGLPIRV